MPLKFIGYIFPIFQAFARLSAVYGGTYMLNKPECKVCTLFLCEIGQILYTIALLWLMSG